jgi:hypothetical protein
MRPISIGPTTPRLTPGQPQPLSRARCGSRSRISNTSCRRTSLGGENEPNFLDLSDYCETSSALAQGGHEPVPRGARGASRPRRRQVGSQDVTGYGWTGPLAALGWPWIGGANEPNFLDLSDRCETSSAATERWSRTRSGGGLRHAQAASHQEGRYRLLKRSRLDRAERVGRKIGLGLESDGRTARQGLESPCAS